MLLCVKETGPLLSMGSRMAIRQLQSKSAGRTLADSSDWTGRGEMKVQGQPSPVPKWDRYVVRFKFKIGHPHR